MEGFNSNYGNPRGSLSMLQLMDVSAFIPALSTLPPSLIPFVLQKVGGARADPGGSPSLKTTGALSTPHSVVNNSLFDFPA